MITTVDNFIAKKAMFDKNKSIVVSQKYCFSYTAKKDIQNRHITLEAFKANTANIVVFDDKNEEDDLILSIRHVNDKYYDIEVGNYIGKFSHNGTQINIKSRFSDTFLTRMLNFANDVYLDDVTVFSAQEKKREVTDYSKFVIYHLFLQKLEKAFLLGMPKAYQDVRRHEMKLKGKLDINRFIKRDVPFKGNISSVSREQKEIQEIIDVLYKAIRIIENDAVSTKNVSHIKTHLKQHKSDAYVSRQTVQKALNAKALHNPVYAPYKDVLRYAKYIVECYNLQENSKARDMTYGYLVNVAMLFETYVTKLLQKEFRDWQVSSPEIKLYEGRFFGRKIIPDIVMRKGDNVLVFDTKYKRMRFEGKNQYGAGDVDRCDFFQIHTYISYFQQQGVNVLAGGLLYPIEEEYNADKCMDDTWLGNCDTKFVIDGIELNRQTDLDDIVNSEKKFIERVRNLITRT